MEFLDAVPDSTHEQLWDMIHWYGGLFDPNGRNEVQMQSGIANMALCGLDNEKHRSCVFGSNDQAAQKAPKDV